MATSVKTIITKLHALEKDWPKGYLLFASATGGGIMLCKGHPEDGGKIVETFSIPSDGGDPDWADDAESEDAPKRLVKFRAPSTRVLSGPRPQFVGPRAGDPEESQ